MQKLGGYQSIRGFTIIEILVAMIITAIGLLGLAAMQTLAIKDQQNAFFFAQAASLAYEMSDRIKVNPLPWRATSLPASTPCNYSCTVATPCSASQMATFDYCAWQSNAKNRIDSNTFSSVATNITNGICTGASGKLCLTIGWGAPAGSRTFPYNYYLEITP